MSTGWRHCIFCCSGRRRLWPPQVSKSYSSLHVSKIIIYQFVVSIWFMLAWLFLLVELEYSWHGTTDHQTHPSVHYVMSRQILVHKSLCDNIVEVSSVSNRGAYHIVKVTERSQGCASVRTDFGTDDEIEVGNVWRHVESLPFHNQGPIQRLNPHENNSVFMGI